MKTFSQVYRDDTFSLSFELFPPKTDAGTKNLFRHVDRLVQLNPSFITCTYGAGGTTQGRTLEVVEGVMARCSLPVATHLTCVGSSVDGLRDYLRRAQASGINNVVALRGDPPQGETEFRVAPGGFSYASELVTLIRSEFDGMGIAVGGYPETHQQEPSPEVDLKNLKRKVDAGADVVITQLFYNNEDFLRFRERCERLGITVPIVPGLLPVNNGAQVQRITSLCGARLPADFLADLNRHPDDLQAQQEIGIDFAIRQTAGLLEAGVPGIHFYVLNKSESVVRIIDSVKLPQVT